MAVAALAALSILAGPAGAATFVVNTTTDHAVNGCAAAPGDCTLREAITAANATDAFDAITLPSAASSYAINNSLGNLPSIATPMDIDGGGAASTIIDAGGGTNITRMLPVTNATASPITVNIRDLTLQGVTHGDGGSAILQSTTLADTLNVVRVVIRNNTNSAGGSVGVLGINSVPAIINIVSSTIAGNHQTTDGGVVGVIGSNNLTVRDSTIANNTGVSSGVALSIGVLAPGTPTTIEISNSTISGNTASFGTVIADNTGVGKFSYNTITGNTSGGGLAVLARGSVSGWTFRGNVITGNTGTNCSFTAANAVTQGFNFDSGTSCAFTNASDHQSTPVALGALQDNGGPTATHALPAGSPAIDAGGLGGCTRVGGTALTTDQRGIARPNGAACDSGAFEFVPPPPPPPPSGGGGGGGTGGGGTGGGADTTKPVLSAASASPTVFAVNPSGRAETPVAAKVARGTRLRYTLSEAARVVFTIQRAAPGRKVGRRCVKPTARNRSAKRCTRWVRVGRFAVASHAGASAHRFSGKIGRRTLAPGRYRALLVATDAAGNRSARKAIAFRVVRAPRSS